MDAGEIVSATLKREFSEETLGGVNHDALESLWKTGTELYRFKLSIYSYLVGR